MLIFVVSRERMLAVELFNSLEQVYIYIYIYKDRQRESKRHRKTEKNEEKDRYVKKQTIFKIRFIKFKFFNKNIGGN